MKLLLVAVVAVCLCWEGVRGESCSVPSDCTTTACVDGSPPVCLGRICTCTEVCKESENLGRCRSQQDCRFRYQAGQLDCQCPSEDLHCLDDECHCIHLNFP